MNRNALKTYGTQQVMTASPAELVALLYDKAIVSLREAIQAIEKGAVNERWTANNKATEIITHLMNTLDYEAGGEIAQNLQQLYRFMLDRLFEVDMRNDADAARGVIGLLEPLRDSWRELADQSSTQQQAAPAPAAPAPQPAVPRAEPASGYGQSPDGPRDVLNISA